MIEWSDIKYPSEILLQDMDHYEEEKENLRKVKWKCWNEILTLIWLYAQVDSLKELIDRNCCLLFKHNIPKVKLNHEIQYDQDLCVEHYEVPKFTIGFLLLEQSISKHEHWVYKV